MLYSTKNPPLTIVTTVLSPTVPFKISPRPGQSIQHYTINIVECGFTFFFFFPFPSNASVFRCNSFEC